MTRPGPRSAASWPSGTAATAGSGSGPVRDAVLEVTRGDRGGELIRSGAPLVKNVTGFDLCRLLGRIARAPWRCWARWSCGACPDRRSSRGGSARAPTRSRSWPPCTGPCRSSGTATRTWVGLAGYAADVTRPGRAPCSGRRSAPVAAPRRPARAASARSRPPAALRDAAGGGRHGRSGGRLAGRGRRRCGALHARGGGRLAPRRGAGTRRRAALHQALKARFDPQGRLNPGRSVLAAVGDVPVASGRRRPAGGLPDRRRRPGRLRVVRAVPAPLPDLPGDRRGGAVAPRADRGHAGRRRGRARSTPPSPGSCRPACSAGPARRRARRRSRSGGSWRGPASSWRPGRCRGGSGLPTGCSGSRRALAALTAAGAVAQRACGSSRARSPGACRCPGCRCGQRPLRATGDDVWLFTGCVMDAWQRDIHRAAIAVLGACGAGVALPGSRRGLLRRPACARRAAATTPPAWPGGSWPPSRARRPSWSTPPVAGPPSRTTGTCSARDEAQRVRGPGRRHPRVAGGPRRPAPGPWRPGPGRRPRIAVQDPCHLRHVQRGEAAVRVVLEPLRRPGGTGRRGPVLWRRRGVQRPAAGCSPARSGPRSWPSSRRRPPTWWPAPTRAAACGWRRPACRSAIRSEIVAAAGRAWPAGRWPVSSRTSGAGWRRSPRSWPTWPWCACGSRSMPAGRELPVDERRLTRARRAVEKAAAILAEPDDRDDGARVVARASGGCGRGAAEAKWSSAEVR